MTLATRLTLRTGVTAHQQLLLRLHPHHLPFLLPSPNMSRRSTRLSGQLASSPPSSIESSNASRAFSTSASAAAGSSSSVQRQKKADPNAVDSSTPLEEWSTADLQAEVKRYGFKVSRKRATLIEQLRAVFAALQRTDAPLSRIGPMNVAPVAAKMTPPRTTRKLILPDPPTTALKTKAKGKGKGRQSDPFILDVSSDSDLPSSPVPVAINGQASNDSEGEAGDYTAQLELEALSATSGSPSIPSSPDIPLSTSVSPVKQRRSRSRSLSSSPEVPLSASLAAEEDVEAVEPTAALANTMTTAIRSNSALWDRILKYEPISFDELVSVATQNGLSMAAGKSKEELRTWLDRQCICFYSNDLTGPRSRH